jgi:5-methyltetrahydropteroyltriglutamate--homocysteine methyltransferase
MRRSTDRILTTHVGALPAPHDVWARLDVSDDRLREAVAEVCASQRRAGVDFINEGELTKGGHWTEYLAARLGGYEPAGHPGALGELLLSSTDWVEFRDFYMAVLQNGTLFEQSGEAQHVPEGAEETTHSVEDWEAATPIHYRGHTALDREIAVMLAALGDTPA